MARSMLSLLLVIVLNLNCNVFGLICLSSDEPQEWSFDNFDLAEFELEIDRSFVNESLPMCRIEIYLNYENALLVISFGYSFHWSQLDSGEARLDFSVTFHQLNSIGEYFHVVEFACDNEHFCDKAFLFNQIQSLILFDYLQLELHLKPFLSPANSTSIESCYISRTNVSQCSTKVCVGKYIDYYKNYLFQCSEFAHQSVELYLITNFIVLKDLLGRNVLQETQTIEYICLFDRCNRFNFTDQLIEIIGKYYSLDSIKAAFFSRYSTSRRTTTIPSEFNVSFETVTTTDDNKLTSVEFVNNQGQRRSKFVVNMIVICFLNCKYLFFAFD